jgi:hypothetical protein
MELNMRGDYGEVEVQIRDQMSVESIDMGIVSRPPPLLRFSLCADYVPFELVVIAALL